MTGTTRLLASAAVGSLWFWDMPTVAQAQGAARPFASPGTRQASFSARLDRRHRPGRTRRAGRRRRRVGARRRRRRSPSPIGRPLRSSGSSHRARTCVRAHLAGYVAPRAADDPGARERARVVQHRTAPRRAAARVDGGHRRLGTRRRVRRCAARAGDLDQRAGRHRPRRRPWRNRLAHPARASRRAEGRDAARRLARRRRVRARRERARSRGTRARHAGADCHQLLRRHRFLRAGQPAHDRLVRLAAAAVFRRQLARATARTSGSAPRSGTRRGLDGRAAR